MNDADNVMVRRGVRILAGLGLGLALACGSSSSSTSTVTSPLENPADPNGWNGSKAIETNPTYDSWLPVVAMDSTGNAFAPWQKTAVAGSADNLDLLWGAGYQASSNLWQADQAFSSLTGSQDVQVAGDGKGNFLYVWDVTSDSNTFSVYVNTYSTASGMGRTPQPLSAGNSGLPAIAMNANGAACVAWQKQGSTYMQIWASQLNPATGLWSSPQQVSTTTATDAFYPVVGLDSAGDAAIMWAQGATSTSGPFVSELATFVSGSSWSAPWSPNTPGTTVDALFGPGKSFTLTMNDSGAHAVWAQSGDSGQTYAIGATRWTLASGTWSTPVDVSGVGGYAIQPTIGQDASANAIAAWAAGGTSSIEPMNITTAAFTPTGIGTGVWQTPQILAVVQSGAIDDPTLAVNATGAAVLAYDQFDGNVWRVCGSTFLPNPGWVEPVYIQTPSGGNADWPNASISANGQAMVVWDQGDSNGMRHIYANRFN